MEPAKSSNYYFPGVSGVERAPVPDDEFDGTQLDDNFIEKLSSLAPEWRDAILRAQEYGVVELHDTEEYVVVRITNRNAKIHPAEKQWAHNAAFWHESITSAAKRGWHWSGDTDVWVRYLNAHGRVDLLLSFLLDRSFECYVRKHAPLDTASAASWKSFWHMGFSELEHDLPSWPGKPTDVVFLRRDGNTTIVAGEKGLGTYCVVTMMTS